MASLKDIKVNINVDTADFIKSLRQLQESIKMDNVRILKGWTKKEQKELEDAKKKYMNGSDLLHIITSFPSDTESDLIWQKYDKADKDEQITIIKDILDFYTGNAKFPEQKYYIKMPKVRYSYLFKDVDGTLDWGNDFGVLARKYFTEDEIKDIDPRYMAFAVPVEADDE